MSCQLHRITAGYIRTEGSVVVLYSYLLSSWKTIIENLIVAELKFSILVTQANDYVASVVKTVLTKNKKMMDKQFRDKQQELIQRLRDKTPH
jgi:hypothetical protein